MVVKIGKILAVILATCLSIILMSALRVSQSAFTQEQKKFLQKELSRLSYEEQERLKELFDHHFFFSDFAYTLFGSKPMSIGRLLPTHTGWESWGTINRAFDSKEFVIRKYTFNDCEFLLVANLTSIEKVYRQNKQLFEGLMSFDTLIRCLREDGPLFQQLMRDHLLLGILLGYGTHNAELFSENQNLSREGKVTLCASSWKLHPIFYIFSEVMPVSFACDPTTEETKELQRRYTEERKAILKMAQRDPLFFQMLVKLSEGGRQEDLGLASLDYK